MKFTINFLRTLSVFSILYFVIILWLSGIKTSFLSFWVALSASCLGISFLLSYLTHKTDSPYPMIRYILVGMIWFSLIVVAIVEGVIICEGLKKPEKHADYVIVLGAQVRGTVPSKALYGRILAATKYLIDNPDSLVICSGGQGPGEHITEAQAIKNGLLANGIPSDRILLEEASTNTVENLSFCKQLIKDPTSLVVIVTSDFHIFRAKKIAEHLGYQNLSMCPDNKFLPTTVSYYIREFFALFKDLAVGNLY